MTVTSASEPPFMCQWWSDRAYALVLLVCIQVGLAPLADATGRADDPLHGYTQFTTAKACATMMTSVEEDLVTSAGCGHVTVGASVVRDAGDAANAGELLVAKLESDDDADDSGDDSK